MCIPVTIYWIKIGYSYEMDGWGSIPGRSKIFLYSTASTPTLGPTQPAIKWVPRHLSRGVKRQGRETDLSPPSSAEVKNGGAV
jgi:hypothetical protein